MGKGEIISHIGNGQYSVKMLYGGRAANDSKIAKLQAKLTALETQISGMEDGLAKNVLRLQAEALKKTIAQYQTLFPPDPTQSVWCADLTEDLAPGAAVGTIDIPGEMTQILVRPGYDGRAVYSGPRDGAMWPGIAQTPANWYWNISLLPAWQRYKPIYRVGTIVADSIDFDANTCTVCLDAAYSSQKSLPAVDGLDAGDCDTTNPVTSQVTDFCSRYPSHPFCTGTQEGAPITLTETQLAQLKEVNEYVNSNYGRATDASGIRMGDSWDVMSPGGSGDCEDFALTKMKRLVDNYGWSAANIKMATAYAGNGEGHALLIVRTTNKGIMALDINYNNVMESGNIPYRLDRIALTKAVWRSYTRRLEAVPIEYLYCNAAAFADGDRVVVEFADQDWTSPKVIGFEAAPQSCAWGIISFPGSLSHAGNVCHVIRSDDLAITLGADSYTDDANNAFAAAGGNNGSAYRIGGKNFYADPPVESKRTIAYQIHSDVISNKSDMSEGWIYNNANGIENNIFHLSGLNQDESKINDSIEKYATATDSWSSVKAIKALWGVATFVLNGKIYISGGCTRLALNNVYALTDPPTEQDGYDRLKFDPVTEVISTFNASPSFQVVLSAGFASAGKGHVGWGMEEYVIFEDDRRYESWAFHPDFWQYDPETDAFSSIGHPDFHHISGFVDWGSGAGIQNDIYGYLFTTMAYLGEYEISGNVMDIDSYMEYYAPSADAWLYKTVHNQPQYVGSSCAA